MKHTLIRSAIIHLISTILLLPLALAQQCTQTCTACSTSGGCLTCLTGYRPVQATCQQIGIPFCIQLNTQNSCTRCREGYRLQSGNCVICSVTGCKKCDSNISTCDECYDGLFFREGNCATRCTVGNCSLCKSSVETCDRCLEGFRLNQGKTQCQTCGIANCKNCDVDTRICTDCKKDYFLDGEDCTLCPFGCANCTNSTSCQLCDEQFGYYMKTDLTCAKGCWGLRWGVFGAGILIIVSWILG